VLAAIFDGYGPHVAILTAIVILVAASAINQLGVPGQAGLSHAGRVSPTIGGSSAAQGGSTRP